MGRRRGPYGPSKLTPMALKKLTRALSIGAGIEEACLIAQISRTSYYRWLEKGELADTLEKENNIYREFFLQVKRTLAETEIYSLSIIFKAMGADRPDSWRAASWFLQSRYPLKWSKRAVGVQSNVDMDVHVDDPADREERVARISQILEKIPDPTDVPEPLSPPELEGGIAKEEKEKKKRRMKIPA